MWINDSGFDPHMVASGPPMTLSRKNVITFFLVCLHLPQAFVSHLASKNFLLFVALAAILLFCVLNISTQLLQPDRILVSIIKVNIWHSSNNVVIIFTFVTKTRKPVFLPYLINSPKTHIGVGHIRWSRSADWKWHHRNPSLHLQVQWSDRHCNYSDLDVSVKSAWYSVL